MLRTVAVVIADMARSETSGSSGRSGPRPRHHPQKKGKGTPGHPPVPHHPYSLNPYSLTTFILIVPTPQRQKGRGNAGKAPEGNNIAGMARSYREIRHLR